ncbi:MAG: ImmA/IrrE family metallo-endopeptidase [Gemmatimonas sp.]|nr:ImmA/IrrE family metallo-endopeptidase [Gemmatimonas sp.]
MDDFNGELLALARERSGLTKRDLARKMDCSERIVGRWERGAPPGTENISKLGRVLNRPTSFFFGGAPDHLPVESVSFRALTRMTSSDRTRALALARMTLRLNAWLEESFKLPKPEIPDLRHQQQDPEAAAMSLRARWSLGDKPIKSMVALLEYKGIRVFSLAEDCRELNAYAFWYGRTPFVFLNQGKSSEASRFDAAHELGHLVLHQHGSASGRTAEHEANAFAGAFLMPRSSLVAFAPRSHSLPRLIQAKGRWNVSVAALAYRLREIGLISEWNYRSLCIEIQKAGFRTSEPDSAPRETSQVFAKVFSALREEKVGKREVAARLGWTIDELESVVFGPGLVAMRGGDAASRVPTPKPSLRVLK